MNTLDRSRIGKASKRKGNSYERRVATLIQEFVGINCRRVPQSGSFNKTGGAHVKPQLFYGDIICDSDKFAYSVEAKNKKTISITAVLKNPSKSELVKAWRQCVGDAIVSTRKPMMLFKPNHGEDWACFSLNDDIFSYLKLKPHMILHIVSDIPDIILITWNNLIAAVDPTKLFINA